jgi:beta-lactam-binding protein with PASTA domain
VFKFLTNKPLWVNIVAAFVLAVVLILLVLSSLNFFTKHGRVLRIPAVTGKTYEEAKKSLEQQGFEVVIQDSVYKDTLKPSVVLRQFPDADELVKVNRTVFLTINRTVPPEVVMPNLVGMSFRNAEIVIKQFGFKMGDTSYKPDFTRNTVLNQSVDDKEVQPGTKLPMGTRISLTLSGGPSGIDLAVPDLTGMTFNEAKAKLGMVGISFGSAVYKAGITDSANAFIYDQDPKHLTQDGRVSRIRAGQMIDIWLQAEKPVHDSTAAKPQDDGSSY